MKKVKNKNVLIISPGNSLKKYEDKIKDFIKNNDIIVIGCNVINNFITPDYHFWGSTRRLIKYGKEINEKSVLIFPPNFSKKLIKKFYKKPYEIYNPKERLPGTTIKSHKNIYDYFKNITCIAILWSYSNGASKIKIAGMDGYTYYPEEELSNKEASQHFYGKGFSDGQDYSLCRRKDIRNYKVLKNLYKYGKKKYGFKFEIITPTIYNEFYNPNVLDIKEKYEGKDISLENKKDFKISKNKFIKDFKY